jgi:transcriptional regulator with XRE-family HTH domain
MSNSVPGLKPLREEKGLTQRALADAVGLSEHAIYLFESGRTAPSLDTLKRLAQALGVQPGALLDEPATPAEGVA